MSAPDSTRPGTAPVVEQGTCRLLSESYAMGRFCGRVAHDFNNLLTVISGYAQLLGEHPLNSDARAGVLAIQQASDRAAGLTQQLLAFSRTQVLQPVNLNLNRLIEDASVVLAQVVGESIQLEMRLSKKTHPVRLDPVQTEQLLIMLASNAREAMETGGVLTIATENVVLDKASEVLLDAGQYVLMRVRDTGCGMDAVTRSHIFEPFFTTKDRRRRAGLGLSAVHGIVQQSGGALALDTRAGSGTEFRIYFPFAGSSEL